MRIFLHKNLAVREKSIIFALDFGKDIFQMGLNGFRRKRSRMGKIPPKRVQKVHKKTSTQNFIQIGVRMKFAAKIQKENEFTKFLDNKIK